MFESTRSKLKADCAGNGSLTVWQEGNSAAAARIAARAVRPRTGLLLDRDHVTQGGDERVRVEVREARPVTVAARLARERRLVPGDERGDVDPNIDRRLPRHHVD